jgi:DNA-binding XRE family transcriptional regulator
MIPGVPFDLGEFRVLLRAKRELLARGEKGRERFAERIGVNKSTVQNAEMGPDIPGIDTCAKIIEGVGYTLSEFFRELESQDKSATQTVISSHTSSLQSDNEAHKDRPHLPVEAFDHAAPVHAATIEVALLQRFVTEAFDGLYALIERIGDHVGASQQRPTSPPAHAPVRRPRARHGRRKAS